MATDSMATDSMATDSMAADPKASRHGARRNRARRHGARGHRTAWYSIAVLAVLAMLVTACGGGSENGSAKSDTKADEPEINADNCPVDSLAGTEQPIEISVWHAYNALTQKTLEEAAAEYNASQSKVKVTVSAQGSYPELLTKYENRMNDPSSLPDVIFSEDTTLRFMIDSGTVIPAADCIAADPDSDAFYKDLLPAIRSTYSVKDVLWPASFGVSMPILFVNNTLMKGAGLDSMPLETLADVRAAAEKIKAAGIAGVEEPVVMQLYGWYPENWITGAGETIVNEANGHNGLATKSTFDNKATREVLEWLRTMKGDGLMKAYPYSAGIDQFLAIGNQSSALLIDGSRAITAVHAVAAGAKVEGIKGVDSGELEGIEVKVLPIPGLKKAGQAAAAGSAAFLVAGQDEAKIAAGWDFLQFFNTPSVQTRWTTKGSYLPVTKSLQDSSEMADFFSNDPAGKLLGVVNEQLQNANPDFPSPVMGPYDWFRANLHSMLERVVIQQEPIEENLGTFDSAFQDQLTQYASEVGG